MFIKLTNEKGVNMKFINSKLNADDLWSICGNFEPLYGKLDITANGAFISKNEYDIYTVYTENEYGVTVRRDFFKNKSERELTVNGLLSKFTFNGGDYEVYTQFDGWCNESRGSWQPLVTTVCASACGIWESINATPMLALWNRQTSRGTVFHVVCDCAWQISATKKYSHDECASVIVEAGLNRHNLAMRINPGETVELPKIICYNFKSKTDLDCFKLHHFCNTEYPRRELPVAFNTWLCDFQNISFESITKQINPAADIGAEYFVIDAGWFYKDSDGWNTSRGDWYECRDYGIRGRMKEISDMVRKNGMKFGFWIEPSVAGTKSDAIKKHRELFMYENDKYMLDFSLPEAVDYITEITFGIIEKYNAEYIKFDFNQEILFDNSKKAFKDYFIGYYDYITRIKTVHPEVYLECCAGGGARMTLNTLPYFDSYWLSDNQSIYHSMRIFKDTLLRMPPQMIEKWITVACIPDFPASFDGQRQNRIFSTDDATFSRATEVKKDFLEGFTKGSPVGLSCDIASMTPDVYEHLRNVICDFKKERSFWKNAVCRILTDTDGMLVLQYSNMELSQVKILVYTFRKYQDAITVYPVLSTDSEYTFEGKNFSSEFISENGIDIETDINYGYYAIELKKI